MSDNQPTYVVEKPQLLIGAEPRPTSRAGRMYEDARKYIVDQINQWSSHGYIEEYEDDDESDERTEMLEAWIDKQSWEVSDGYELARGLDRDLGYNPDMGLCEILEHASSLIRRTFEQAVEQWIERNGIKPTLEEGTPVEGDWSDNVKVRGYVVAVKRDRAKYVISRTKGETSRGFYSNYEDTRVLSDEESKELTNDR